MDNIALPPSEISQRKPQNLKPQNLVLYCRLPKLLVLAAKRMMPPSQRSLPLTVVQDRFVRAACDRSDAAGIGVGQSVLKARRLCPTLVTSALDVIDPHTETAAFLDALADIAERVEPEGPDAAYAVIPSFALREMKTAIAGLSACFGPAVVGTGASRLAAHACAECCLPADRLAEATVEWLWPDDARLVAALRRLGLSTFGEVAAVGEGALFYQFGKVGRVLHRRALGQDLMPVRSLYPPLRADARLDLEEFPVTLRGQMETALTQIGRHAAEELRLLGRHGQRVVLRLRTETGQHRQEWLLPAPIQNEAAVRSAAMRLFSQMSLNAPVTEVRLLVEGLVTPAARTTDLFARGPGDDPAALEAIRRSLQARFGTSSVMFLSHRPQSVRDERRACLHEKWQLAEKRQAYV